jgi:hypothetical protein
MTCWRRLRDWQQAGVRQQLHEPLLADLNAAGALDWSRFPAPDHTGRDGRGHRCRDDRGA